MENQKIHWPSILCLIGIIPGTGLFITSAFGFAIQSLFLLVTGGADPAGPMISAVAAGFEGILLLITGIFVFQKTRGKSGADANAYQPFIGWRMLIAVLFVLISLLTGAAVAKASLAWLNWLLLPVLTILVIVLPIWIFSSLGTQGLNLGPRWRAWGIVGIGMTLGPLVMLVLETLIGVVFVIMAALFLVSQPELVNEILRQMPSLSSQPDPEKLIEQFLPYILNPGVIAALLAFIALLVPMIEELFKPLGVWLFARRIETPAQGFALGILSGAAYALVESRGVSGSGGTAWGVVVGVRAGTSLLHITTSGLMGWAIISAIKEKRYLRLLAMYMIVVLIHGIWNASSVGIGIAVLADTYRPSQSLIPILVAATSGMLVLVLGMPILLNRSNRMLNKTENHPLPGSQGKNPSRPE